MHYLENRASPNLESFEVWKGSINFKKLNLYDYFIFSPNLHLPLLMITGT